MDYDALLSQVIELLQRQGRVSYWALKRRFDLSDDDIEGLQDELIYAQHVARDEDNRVLVWIGKAEEIASPPAQSTQQPASQQAHPTQAKPPPTEPHTREAERRQLTVMFCDLVDSTKLSSQLDPEDYREVVRDYQQVCSEVIQRYDGHVAQLLGDGLLVYFGYPQAHEDDAQRAIHTGLGIVEAIRSLNTGLEQEKGIKLAVRLGIHTGLAVVGEMGGEGRQEQLALGETPNVAARIQGLAQPNTVVISDATHRLVQGYFDAEPLGEHDLRGVAQPIAVYRVLDDRGIQSRLDVASSRGLTPLVGRESESTLLFERWEQAKDGNGQVVLLSGEAGIGKSRLVQVIKDHVADEPHIRMECRSSPYFTNSALYPIIDMVQRTLRFQTDDTPEQKLEKLIQNLRQYRLPLEETVPLFGVLLSLPVPEDRYPTLSWTPQRQRQKTLESIVAILLELAERQPVLFILEDAHWLDASTNELLDLLIDQTPTASLLILITYRPEFQHMWGNRSYLTQVTLNRLSRDQVEQLATQVAGGKTLPSEVIEQLVDKTDGVPLYVEEMTKTVLESGLLKDVEGEYELRGPVSSLSIPATLQDSLMARLDRLVTAKGVAQYASVVGRQFSYELLRAVSELDEATLQRELGRLVEAELVYQRGLPPNATYTFKHALVQDTAYESLLRNTRQGYHRRIAEVLEERFPETVDTQPELLAHHYTEAGMNEQAVGYWQNAGQRALQRSAHIEVINYLTKGLEVLQGRPETPQRDQQELPLCLTLGRSLMSVKGYAAPDVEQIFARAYVLCQQVEEPSYLLQALGGLWTYHLFRGDLPQAREIAEHVHHLAQRQHDPISLGWSHFSLGATLSALGEFVPSSHHLEQSLAVYDPQQRYFSMSKASVANHPSVLWRGALTLSLWLLGYPDQAVEQNRKALTIAQDLSHPFSIASAFRTAARTHQYRRDARLTQECADVAIALTHEYGFTQLAAEAMIYRGWVLATQNQLDEGMRLISQGLDTLRATGVQYRMAHFLAMLAEVHGMARQVEAGLAVLAEALNLVSETGERRYESELYHLKGELLLQQSPDNHTEAESCFQQAITIAQNQNAKSWELRAATSLAKLWQSQNKRQEAYDMLAPVYGWFTEGFDTADLKDAKVLLDELS